MSFQLIGAGSDLGSTQTQMNKNILELKNNETTTVFKDDTGTRRVLLGKGADGFYGLKVSQEGVDVHNASDDELVFNSNQNVFKIVDTITLVTPEFTLNSGGANYASNSSFTDPIAHGMSAPPIVSGHWDRGGLSGYTPLPFTYTPSTTTTSFYTITVYCKATSTDVYGGVLAWGYNVNVTIPAQTIKCYILQETAN